MSAAKIAVLSLAAMLMLNPCFPSYASAAMPGPEQKNIDRAAADYAGIAKAVEYYFEAGRKGDSSYMKQVFLPDANIYFTRDGKVAGGGIQILYDMVEGKPSPTEIIYKITSVEVSGNIATVRLDIADWAGHAFIDMFTMIKDGDDWKIASKVSRRP